MISILPNLPLGASLPGSSTRMPEAYPIEGSNPKPRKLLENAHFFLDTDNLEARIPCLRHKLIQLHNDRKALAEDPQLRMILLANIHPQHSGRIDDLKIHTLSERAAEYLKLWDSHYYGLVHFFSLLQGSKTGVFMGQPNQQQKTEVAHLVKRVSIEEKLLFYYDYSFRLQRRRRELSGAKGVTLIERQQLDSDYDRNEGRIRSLKASLAVVPNVTPVPIATSLGQILESSPQSLLVATYNMEHFDLPTDLPPMGQMFPAVYTTYQSTLYRDPTLRAKFKALEASLDRFKLKKGRLPNVLALQEIGSQAALDYFLVLSGLRSHFSYGTFYNVSDQKHNTAILWGPGIKGERPYVTLTPGATRHVGSVRFQLPGRQSLRLYNIHLDSPVGGKPQHIVDAAHSASAQAIEADINTLPVDENVLVLGDANSTSKKILNPVLGRARLCEIPGGSQSSCSGVSHPYPVDRVFARLNPFLQPRQTEVEFLDLDTTATDHRLGYIELG